jgi:ABC-type sugar transport system permease subunit
LSRSTTRADDPIDDPEDQMAEIRSIERPTAFGNLSRRFRQTWLGPRRPYWGLLFVLPILGFLIVFKFWPMVRAIRLSFFEASPASRTETFVGLENYTTLANDPLFHKAVGVTASYVVGTVAPLMVLSLLLALLLNQKLRGRSLFRSLIFLPAIVPVIIVPILWRVLFHPYGLANEALILMGLSPVDWLQDVGAVIWALIIPTEWRFVPLYMIIYLAGLQSIPEDLYDAAKVDGASIIQRFRSITLPLLKPTILVVLIASVTFTAKTIVLPLVMTTGGPNNASTTLSLFIYQTGFAFFNMGYASAASIVLLVIVVAFTIVNLRAFRTDD